MIIALAAAALVGAPAGTETAAVRKSFAAAPNYPAACMPAPGAEARPERVTLSYSVTDEGLITDVRVRESSNSCFDGPAIDHARLWRFSPRQVDGRAVRQDDLETTITYRVSEAAQLNDTDAAPLLRTPPEYPERCYISASTRDTVQVEFDVSPTGATANARVIETTNVCFDKAALASVETWRYAPKILDGGPVTRSGVRVFISFDRPSGVGASKRQPDLVRPALASRLKAIRSKLLKKNPDHGSIAAELDEVYGVFGADFRPVEMSSFYPLRGASRLETGNYRGALDDLRIAAALSVDKVAGDAMLRTIEQLEAYIAAEDAALAVKSE